MNKYIKLSGMLLLFAVTTFGLSGCKQDGCIDPVAVNYDVDADKDDGSCIYETEMAIKLNTTFGASDFSYGSEYTLDNGRKVSLSIARFYLSNIRLVNGSTETALTDVYAQFTGSKDQLMLGEAPAGSYTGLRFDIGVDSVANFSDPGLRADDHPLSSSSSTFDHWSWSSGYIFMKVEGRADTTAAGNGVADGPFVYHVGTLNFLRNIDLAVDFNVVEGLNNQVEIAIDVKRFFENVDLTSEWDTHTMNDMPLAMKIANNIQASVSAQ